MLHRFVSGTVAAAGAIKTRREKKEAWELESRRREELRRQELEEAAREKARLQQLIDDCEAWHQATRLRELLAALERRVQQGVFSEVYGRSPEDGLKRARKQIAHFDPLGHR